MHIYRNTHCTHKPDSFTADFGVETAETARGYHRSIDEYCETPLVCLKDFAAQSGIKGMYLKDESKRFGLNAFKGLGGSFAMSRIPEDVRDSAVFITATDGNHGRGVAWAAKKLGKPCVVYLPKGTAKERLDNILAQGADASITDLCYDDAVRKAAEDAERNGWILVQDTSREGYTEIPYRIMQGYTTMALEAADQMGDTVPTHVFLQSGVGSMAGAVAAFLEEYYKGRCPVITIIEPYTADCMYKTAEADDGKLHSSGKEMNTIMAGLACGEPCSLAWDILRTHADYFVSMPDSFAEFGMRLLARPVGNDSTVESGESGASAFGFAASVASLPEYSDVRKQLGINEDSVILCFSTEGATDRENYRKIVGK